MTDPAGDTAELLAATGAGSVARLDAEEEIRTTLHGFLEALRRGDAPVAEPTEISRHSRRARTAEFAQLLDTVVGDRIMVAA